MIGISVAMCERTNNAANDDWVTDRNALCWERIVIRNTDSSLLVEGHYHVTLPTGLTDNF